MGIKIVGGQISDCGIGVSATGPVDLEVQDLVIRRTEQAYDLNAVEGSSVPTPRRFTDRIMSSVCAELVSEALLKCLKFLKSLFQ